MTSLRPSPRMYKFPSIHHFDKFLAHMRRTYPSASTVDAIGTVKLHGVHIDVVGVFNRGTLQNIQIQSRNLVMEESNTMHGVYKFMSKRRPTLEKLLEQAYAEMYTPERVGGSDLTYTEADEIVLLAGEFIGENVQPNVALQHLNKCFVIFNIQSNHGWWTAALPVQAEVRAPESQIFHIAQAPLFHVSINTETGEGREKLEELVEQIEAECPFAAMFNVHGMGEGAVFKARGYEHDPDAWFKVKGRQHRATTIRSLKPKTQEENAEIYANAETFVRALVAPRRLEQGIEYLVENEMKLEMKNFPTFALWVQEDAWKEEEEEIQNSGFEWGMLKKRITVFAVEYYQARLRESVGRPG